jgi:hypothetical protein
VALVPWWSQSFSALVVAVAVAVPVVSGVDVAVASAGVSVATAVSVAVAAGSGALDAATSVGVLVGSAKKLTASCEANAPTAASDTRPTPMTVARIFCLTGVAPESILRVVRLGPHR